MLCFYYFMSVTVICVASAQSHEHTRRVYDGQDLRFDVHKYLVAFNIRRVNGTLAGGCAGSILNERWILTSAQCFAVNHTDIIINHRINNARSVIATVNASDVFIHPNYNRNEHAYFDLALLKTTVPMEFGSYVSPIELAEVAPEIGEEVILAGYGASESGLSKPREATTVLSRCLTPLVGRLCINGTKGMGIGDAGGPLISNNKLVGVASQSNCLAETFMTGCLSVYISVADSLQWIRSTIEEI